MFSITKKTLTKDEAIRDIKILCEIENSIYDNGVIEDDGSGYFESEKDNERASKLYDVMYKYSYGWYICQSQSIQEQTEEINAFKNYILSNIGNEIEIFKNEF